MCFDIFCIDNSFLILANDPSNKGRLLNLEQVYQQIGGICHPNHMGAFWKMILARAAMGQWPICLMESVQGGRTQLVRRAKLLASLKTGWYPWVSKPGTELLPLLAWFSAAVSDGVCLIRLRDLG